MNALVSASQLALPALVSSSGERAQTCFWEFFAARIRNRHTRRAYAIAAREFLTWCEAAGVASIADVKPLHVAAYVEQLGRARSAPTVKQRLAAIRHLFDWLVTGQVMAVNPAASVRGPSHSVKRGKTPVLDPSEARALIAAIDATTPVGLRDRALISLMVYSFARIGAALAMRVEDVYVQNRRLWVRLHEKGRQAPRNALPPQSRGLPARLCRPLRACQRPEGAAVPDDRPRDGRADHDPPAPGERLRHDPPARRGRRHRDEDRQSRFGRPGSPPT